MTHGEVDVHGHLQTPIVGKDRHGTYGGGRRALTSVTRLASSNVDPLNKTCIGPSVLTDCPRRSALDGR